MRLFFALRFRDSALEPVVRMQETLYARFPGARLSRRENFHLTLAFLGEIAPGRVPELRQLVSETRPETIPERLCFPGLIAFPGRGRQTVCLGGDPDPKLMEMQKLLDRELRAMGFSLEERAYRPHMTLARQCPAGALPPLEKPLVLPVEAMSLMLSQRLDGVLTYTPLCSRAIG